MVNRSEARRKTAPLAQLAVLVALRAGAHRVATDLTARKSRRSLSQNSGRLCQCTSAAVADCVYFDRIPVGVESESNRDNEVDSVLWSIVVKRDEKLHP